LDITGIGGANSSQQFSKILMLSGAGMPASPAALLFGATSSTLLGSVVLSGATTISGTSGAGALNIGDSLGVLSGGSVPGSGPLIRGGIGVLQWHVAAGYSGGTVVDGGVLSIATSGSLVGTGNVMVTSQGRLIVREPAGGTSASSVSANSV